MMKTGLHLPVAVFIEYLLCRGTHTLNPFLLFAVFSGVRGTEGRVLLQESGT